jgi:hypothetical protein
MRAHTITTKARVGARGPTKRTIVPRGILALSLAVVLLAATASTASAERSLSPWYCPPLPTSPTTLEQIPGGCLDQYGGGPSFDFGDRQLGTTSPAQGFALGVFCLPNAACNETLNPRIGVSGDYAQTNNCPPTLSATGPGQVQGCVITVTFTPTGTGPKNGTLSTGAGGPTVALSGSGVTTPTPPVLPLRLGASAGSRFALLKRKLEITAITNYDSTLVVGGGVKKTTKQLAAHETTTIKAKVKHLKRLKEKPEGTGKPKVTMKLAATDEFSQTATKEIKVRLYRNGRAL